MTRPYVVVHVAASGPARPWHGSARSPVAALELVGVETFGSLVWTRHRFRR